MRFVGPSGAKGAAGGCLPFITTKGRPRWLPLSLLSQLSTRASRWGDRVEKWLGEEEGVASSSVLCALLHGHFKRGTEPVD